MKESTEAFGAGRVLRSGDNAVAQVIKDAPSLAESVLARSDCAAPSVAPHQVGVLVATVAAGSVGASAVVGPAETELLVAVGDRDLSLSPLRLHRGEHGLILGPARSGRTNVLAAVGSACGERCVFVGDGSGNGGELAVRLGRCLLVRWLC